MSAKGFNIVEDGQIVTLYNPVDRNANGADSPVILLMENYTHASIIISYGADPQIAGVITVESIDDTAVSTATEINFRYYRYNTSQILANGDVPGALTWTTTAADGLIPTAAGVPIVYAIELDAEELVPGDIGFRLCMVDPGAACVVGATAILSGARYAKSSTTQMAVV